MDSKIQETVEKLQYLLHYRKNFYDIRMKFDGKTDISRNSEGIGEIYIMRRKSFLKRLSEFYCRFRKQGNRLKVYLAIPSLNNPIWIIPIANKYLAKSSLAMYQPSRVYSRIYRRIVSFFFGCDLIPFSDNIILVFEPCDLSRSKMSDIGKSLSKIYDIEQLDFALFKGTPGLTYKKTMQIMTNDTGVIRSYVKIGESLFAKELLENEARILNELGELNITTGLVPKVLVNSKYPSCHYLVVSTQREPGCKYTRRIGAVHVRFLGELCVKTLRDVNIVDWLKENIDFNDSITNRVIGYIEYLLDGKKIKSCMIHGDFTPWNMFCTSHGKIFVFDWELGNIMGLPYYDLINFKVKNDIFVRHLNALQILKELDSTTFHQFINHYNNVTRLNSKIEFNVYLLLYLLKEYSLYSGVLSDAKEEIKRKVTISILNTMLYVLLQK